MAIVQTPLEMMKATLEFVQDNYDAMVVHEPVPELSTVMDYVNHKLATTHVPGQLDGFGRRVHELFVQVHGFSPRRQRRFCGRKIRSVNVYGSDDLFLLDLAWAEQELRWKIEEVRRDKEELLEAIRANDEGEI